MKRISAIVLVMLLLSLLVTAVSAGVISLENRQVNAIGDTATINLVLDEAPTGLAGYSLTIAPQDSSVATITAVGFPAWATMKDNSALPASSVSMKAADLGEVIQSGAVSIPLGTITVQGLKEGSTAFTVTVTRMNDDADARMYPTIQSGTFTVTVPSTPTPTPTTPIPTTTITISPTPTTTQTPAPVAGFSATPTSGTAPLTVQFTDASTGVVSAYYWDFNNDLSPDSTSKNPSYTFTQPGTYTVNLAVNGPGGMDYEVKPAYIIVTAAPTPTPTRTPTPTPTTTQPPSHTVPVVSAEVSGNTVVMNWERIADTDFSGYKVVISKNNANPAYPGDGYMFWITSRDTITATLDASNAYYGGDFGGKLKPGETY
ncbi:MAG: PKD domain-containing protein, partial [Methanoregula sp.]|nr:PKD domain-containing protein [Methanoregula sp.]